jgi:UDP-N-acetylglucosamine 3-dehydrogenase
MTSLRIPLRVGVIGLGWFGEVHCDAIIGIPELTLSALSTRNAERLKDLATKYKVLKAKTDFMDVINDPNIDVIVVTTAWDKHKDAAIAALKAGKHVFLEKPITSTLSDGEELIETAKNSECIFFVGHICRFNPRYQAAQRSVASGEIGEIISIKTHRNLPAPMTEKFIDLIGPITSDAIHDIDLILWLTGDSAGEVFAQTRSIRNFNNPDIAQILFKLSSGVLASLEVNWHMPASTPYEVDEYLKVVGTRGSVEVGSGLNALNISTNQGFRNPDSTYWPIHNGVRRGALRDEYLQLILDIKKGKNSEFGRPDAALLALRVALAAESSALQGRVVKF